jgi:hypothetical protein
VTQAELLRYLAEALEALGVEYMIGGSQAAMYYGEPRLTRDIDVIVRLRRGDLPAFVARFPADEFYLDEQSAREAVDRTGQFNIIHPTSGLKIDVYVNPDTPYDRTRLARRRRLPLLPAVEAYFARPEDVILYKLLYSRRVASDLHLRDVVGILRVSAAELDVNYIGEWARHLGVEALWDEVQRQGA